MQHLPDSSADLGTVMTATDLPTLIADRKGTRSYDRLARDCGGVMSGARLQQLAKGAIKEFPTPDVIRGLALGLGTTVTDVVSAIARSLDLDVRYGADPSALVIGSAGRLPAGAREALARTANEMLQLVDDQQKEVGHRGDAAPSTQAEGSSAAEHDDRHPDDMIDADLRRDEEVMPLLGPDDYASHVPAHDRYTLDGERIDPDDHVLAARDADDDAEVEAQQGEA